MRNTRHPRNAEARAGERGAALITMLLVATLVLAAGGALIVSTATTATNAIDATAEKQAYYAAEAGLQMAMNALRSNMQHDAAVAAGTTMSFRTAVTPDSSNGAGRNGGNNTMCGSADANSSRCRLAGWLPYANPADASSTVTNGTVGFRVSVYDPNNSQNVTFSTSGTFTAQGGLPIFTRIDDGGTTLVVGLLPFNNLDYVRIHYVGRPSTTLNNAIPSANTDFGSFQITKVGLGAVLPLNLFLGTFKLTVNQTGPWAATATYTGRMNTPAALSCPGEFFHFNFDKTTLTADGTSYTQTALDAARQFLLPCAAGAGITTTQVQGSVTAPQPKLLVIRSIGFGPKWAQKRLELTVNRSNLAFEAPATVTLRGADDCTPMTFDSGNSNAKGYSGSDNCVATDPTCTPDPPRPAFAVTACDENDAEAGISKPGTVAPDPKIGILDNGTAPGATFTTAPVDTPDFLKTADKARAYLNDLEAAARSEGRYFTGPRSVTTADGTPGSPNITFVNGDCTLDSGVGGLVICTGSVTTSGNISFDGVLLVLGGGTITRNGGGGGDINGSIVVAKFDRTWPAADNALPHPFLAPTFNTNGGGNSDVKYSSTAVNNALSLLGGPSVAGFLEY
jgi:Tfp pilus assembly protein PilX